MRFYEYEKELIYRDQENDLEIGILLTFEYRLETGAVVTDISYNVKGILYLDAIEDISEMVQEEVDFQNRVNESRNYQLLID